MKTMNGKPLIFLAEGLPHTPTREAKSVAAACNEFFRKRGMPIGWGNIDYKTNVPEKKNQTKNSDETHR